MGALFLYSASIFGLLILTPLYYQTVGSHSALEAGLLIAPLGVGAIITMPVAGRLTDRFGSRGLGIAGILLAMAGTLVFTTIGAATPPALLAAALFRVGLGHGLVIRRWRPLPTRGCPSSSSPPRRR